MTSSDFCCVAMPHCGKLQKGGGYHPKTGPYDGVAKGSSVFHGSQKILLMSVKLFGPQFWGRKWLR